MTLEQALELLAQPKARRGGRRRARSRSRSSSASPVTGQPVQLLDGRYGPYVTDGVTNASLPRGTDRRGSDARVRVEFLEGPRRAGSFRSSRASWPRREAGGRRQTGREKARQEEDSSKEDCEEEGRQ